MRGRGREGADDKRDLAAFFSLSGVESHFGTEMRERERERERKAEGNGGGCRLELKRLRDIEREREKKGRKEREGGSTPPPLFNPSHQATTVLMVF